MKECWGWVYQTSRLTYWLLIGIEFQGNQEGGITKYLVSHCPNWEGGIYLRVVLIQLTWVMTGYGREFICKNSYFSVGIPYPYTDGNNILPSHSASPMTTKHNALSQHFAHPWALLCCATKQTTKNSPSSLHYLSQSLLFYLLDKVGFIKISCMIQIFSI